MGMKAFIVKIGADKEGTRLAVIQKARGIKGGDRGGGRSVRGVDRIFACGYILVGLLIGDKWPAGDVV